MLINADNENFFDEIEDKNYSRKMSGKFYSKIRL